MDKVKYRLIDHTADVGIHVYGANMAKLFENGCWALTEILTDPARLFGKNRRDFSVEGADAADLFVNWMRGLHGLYAVERQFVHMCRVFRISDTAVQASITLDPLNPDKHELRTDVKAVTYHDAWVRRTDEGYEAQVIFDT